MREADRQRDKLRMSEVLTVLGDMELEDAHRIIFSCLRSVEVAMEDLGMKPPKYVEHRVSEVRQDMNPDYTPCRRCDFAGKATCDGSGRYSKCKVLRVAFEETPGLDALREMASADGASEELRQAVEAVEKEYAGGDFLVCGDDGCSRGLLRKEYR